MEKGIVGKRVLLSRRDLDMNQDVLARKVGVNRAYISKIERQDVTNTTLEVAINLAEALGVSLSYLIGLSDDPLADGGTAQSAAAGEKVGMSLEMEDADVQRRGQRLLAALQALSPEQQDYLVEIAEALAAKG